MTADHLFSIGSEVGNHLWQSTIFASLIWLMTLALRRNRARIRYALWMAASFKFLLPFSLLLSIGSLMQRQEQIRMQGDQAAYSVTAAVMRPLRLQPDLGLEDSVPDSVQRLKRTAAAVVTIWLCGILGFLSIWLRRERRLRNVLKDTVLADKGREYDALRSLGQEMPIRCSRTVREPSVCGIFRSVLMWPAGLSDHLDDEHLSAIVLHELVHVRNRDNLIAAIHMIVEAVFWFHPLVWWIERKILLERENVCDETVVRRLGNAQAYAASLLKVSRFCVEPSTSYGSGAAGADLRRRIVNIVTYRSVKLSPTRTIMLVLFGLATLVIPLALGMIHALPVYGQVLYRDGPLPSFEVATVKPMPNGPPPTPAPQGGSTVHLFFTPKMLVMYAYNLPDFSEDQIEKGPGWMNETYEIQGKIGDEEYAAMQRMPAAEKQEQIQLMVQSLLKERFNLKVHLEKREQTIYALEFTETGPRLSVAKHEVPDRFGVTHTGLNYELKATGIDLDELARLLGRQPEVGGRGTINKTGLSGNYDVMLRWTRAGSITLDAGAPAPDANEPSYFTAIQEQLGLRLVSTKGQVNSIVVDHIEKPSSN